MSKIKQDVRESVKFFIIIFVSSVVKESTKKLIKSLTQRQRKLLESKTKNMSDDQLEQYFANNSYFRSTLENTINLVNRISSEKRAGNWLEKIQSAYETTYTKNLVKILLWPAPNIIPAAIASIVLLSAVAIPMAIIGSHDKNAELPLANFSTNISSGYSPFTVQFTDLSQNATAWKWDFGDGNSSTQQHPEHTYSSAGNYNVSLTAINGKDKNLKTVTITVLEQTATPVAHFSSNVTEGFVPLSVQFTDLSQNVTGWNWDFGDGTNSTQQNPSHNYTSAGDYPVLLTVSNEKGTDSKLEIISVRGEIVLPSANFITNTTKGYVPLSVGFTDLSKNTTTWNWDFGDGANSSGQNPMHVYSSAGTYTVKLTATNSNGTDSKLAIIMALKQKMPAQRNTILPFANFCSNLTKGYSPLSIQFTDLSKNARTWNWDFGDGKSSTQQNTVHTYSSSGNYTVSLIASNANGKDSKLAIIMVLEQPPVLPVASFTANVTEGNVPLSVQFLDLSKNTAGWSWNFGDGTESTQQNPVHTYSAAGNYTVSLTATNSNDTNSVSATINVSEKPVLPIADFTSNITEGYAPLSIQFLDLSKHAEFRKWNFGDGTNSNEENPVHTYFSAGRYPITLTVTNANGTNSTSTKITVLEQPALPEAAFSPNLTSGFMPLSVLFTDLSKNTTRWKWDFGDGTNSNEQNPTHIYTVAGNYAVNFTAINENGSDSKFGAITVLESPIPYAAYITNWVSNTVSIINTATKAVVATVPVGSRPWGVAVSPDGSKVYVTSQNDHSVSVIDTITKTVIASVNVGIGPNGIAVTPDGKKVYVANQGSNDVSVIDTGTNTVTKTVNVGTNPYGVAISQDGTRVYVANSDSNTVSIIDTATNTVTDTTSIGNKPYGVAINPAGTMLYVGYTEGSSISVIDTTTNEVTATVNVGNIPMILAITPDGKKIYVANDLDNNISVIDTATNTVTDTVSVGSQPHGIAVTPDGKNVYVANWNTDYVSVIDTATNTVTDTVKVEEGPVAFGQFIGLLPK